MSALPVMPMSISQQGPVIQLVLYQVTILIPQTSNVIVYTECSIFQLIILFLACSESCATCTGPNQNDCTSCDAGLYLSINTCVDECPSGTFPDDTSQSCEGCSSFLLKQEELKFFFIDCNAECLMCSGPLNTDCMSCDTTGPTPFLYNSKCYTTCPDGTYPNAADSKCYRITIFHFSRIFNDGVVSSLLWELCYMYWPKPK